jgi:hypothetical protein
MWECRPTLSRHKAKLTSKLANGDNDFAEGVAFTDAGERCGYLGEPERAVDVDADIAGKAQVGYGLEVRRALLDEKHSDPAVGEPADDGADRDNAQQSRHGSPDTSITAAGGEGTPVGEHRAMNDEIEDEVVWLVAPGKVLTSVIDHLVRTDRPHELELTGVVDTGHMRTRSLSQLDRERTRATASAVDKYPTAGSGTVGSL